ncbi:MAG: general secretion pathway protein GspK [Candidatus Nitrohelix vancouverensis]|uniref:General secretion pathway protein GspK n=1 Tax=Candidatus Nitrohelix vancouverensis TaxID=2705534 RepID=A0A7T0C456_9BACT|nr:MAG: general secretion pathway protein GspK [Candidatus Nitrohelix vancouverensis]
MPPTDKIPTPLARRIGQERGIALMAVLWLLVILMALASEFAFSMKTEVNATRNYKDDLEAYFLAKSGVQLAMAEIIRKAKFHSIHPELGWISGIPAQSGTSVSAGEEETQEFFEINRDDIELGQGTVTYSITDENGKIGVNTASREAIIKVLAALGLEVGQDRDIIADSILDWIDDNDTHRLNGAENDYYQSQTPPYKAKNGRIESINELLLVRGVTPELFYGSDEIGAGLKDLFTIYNVRQTNPNTMSAAALRVFYSGEQMSNILSQKTAKGYFNNSTSTHFRVRSTGSIPGGAEHSIEAVFQKTLVDGKPALTTLFWDDNSFSE